MGKLAGDPGPVVGGLPTSGQTPLRTSYSRRVGEATRLRRNLEQYFIDHPDEKGRTWHPRNFGSRALAQRWYWWSVENHAETGLQAPRFALHVRKNVVYITLRTDQGEAWGADGKIIGQPLWYRRMIAEYGEQGALFEPLEMEKHYAP